MHSLSKSLHDGQASLLIVANNVNFDANFVCCLKINILWRYSGITIWQINQIVPINFNLCILSLISECYYAAEYCVEGSFFGASPTAWIPL